jgi:hypothetical protein
MGQSAFDECVHSESLEERERRMEKLVEMATQEIHSRDTPPK